MDTNERIAQWQKMTQEAPDDMAWFSLGSAYKEAKRLEESAKAFAEAIQMNPGLSRAYQEQGMLLVELGDAERAVPILTEGYKVANRRGDRVVQQGIGAMLEKLGKPIPAPVAATQDTVSSPVGDQLVDRRTGAPGTRMSEPPMRGPLGQFIKDHYTLETWRAWIAQGTKVINELRLDFSKPEHQAIYEQQMKEWLEIRDDEIPVEIIPHQEGAAKT